MQCIANTIFPRYEMVEREKKKIIELFRRYFEIDVCAGSGCGTTDIHTY